MKLWFFSLIALGLSACAPELARSPPNWSGGANGANFRLEDFTWSRSIGTASIIGVLVYENGGGKYTCRGRDVVLLPDGAWSRVRIRTLYGSETSAVAPVELVRARSVPAPLGYDQIVRHAPCDAANHFVFSNLPAGGWFTITAAAPFSGDGSPVVIMRRVETEAAPRRVILGAPSR